MFITFAVDRSLPASCLLFVTFLFVTGNENASAAFVPFNGGTSEETAWQAAAGSTVLENFESFLVDTQISTLPSLGIGFDVLDGGGFPQIYSFGGTPHGLFHLGNFPNGINAINQFDDIVVNVLPGHRVTALGYWNGDGNSATLIATAFDASNNELAM